MIFFFMTAYAVIFYAKSADGEHKEANQIIVSQPEFELTMTAPAFCEYGWDDNGIDYGPGYCIISNQSEIPLYSLLVIDQYGEGQALAESAELAPDEIQVWYNAESKIPMFGRQEVKVKIEGVGDRPCVTP